MNEQIEYTYKLYRDPEQQLVVTVDPLVNGKDICTKMKK